MKINSIHLTSFRSFTDTELRTDAPRVLIAGKNGAGKSSVREALRWVLTGRSAVTDARGVGAERLIPDGGTHAHVVLQVAGLGGVARGTGPGAKFFTVEGFTGEGSTQHQALLDRLGVTPALLDAVLDTGRFLSLHHVDAKAMILGLLDVQIPIDGKTMTLDEVDAAYKSAFDARKTAKSKAKAFSLPPLPQSPLSTGQPPPVLDLITAQLAKLRGLLEQAVGASGQVAGRRQALEAQLATAKTYVPYQATISKEQAQAEVGTIEKQVADLEAALEAAVKPSAPKTDAEKVAFYTQRIDALVSHQPKQGCVLDSNVPCETAKIAFTKAAKALQVTLDAMAPVTDEVTPPDQSPLKAARLRLQALRMTVANYEQSAVTERDAAAKVSRLEAELAALPAAADNSADVAGLKERIAKGETLLNQARAYWTALYAHQEGLKAQEALAAEVDALEARCDLLGPNGARVEALKAAFAGFEAQINPVTETFGWTVAFQTDPWGVQANGRAVETYSESEQFLIGIAIQLAIAQMSGVSFAVVDRLDMLDAERRAVATKILMGCGLEQVFILSTREPEQKLPPAKAGVLICHRLGKVDGETVILETVG